MFCHTFLIPQWVALFALGVSDLLLFSLELFKEFYQVSDLKKGRKTEESLVRHLDLFL